MTERTERCETCKWWGGVDQGKSYWSGHDRNDYCRRYPPQITEHCQKLPIMRSDDFCGEWTNAVESKDEKQ